MSLRAASIRGRGVELLSLADGHLPRIAEWLGRPHVARWWDPTTDGLAEIRGHMEAAHVAPYVIVAAERPVGYLQLYHANPDPFWAEHGLLRETFGIDLFLGEVDALGRGLGTRAVRLAVDHLRRQPGAARVHIDPSPDNAVAIRVYERCGFRRAGMIGTPDGPAAYMTLDVGSPV